MKPQILFICGRNKRRSRTAEYIFKNDERFQVRSAGLSPNSNRKVSVGDINWSDLILVMEKEHRNKIKSLFPANELPQIQVLYIEDVYEYLDPRLVNS